MIDPQQVDDSIDEIADKTARQFAGLWFALFGVWTAREFLLRTDSIRAVILAGVALAVPAVAVVRPRAIGWLFRILTAVTRPIGVAVSHALLAMTYFLVLTPLALFFRLAGRDELVRRRPSNATTYWSEKGQPSDLRSYFRQS